MGTESQPDGKELFRELLSLFPGAALEDYYKNGVWQIETMEIDKELIEAHRKEAGAPEPTPLEEVVMPEIPTRPATAAPGSLALRPGIKPLVMPTSSLSQPAPAGTQRIAPLAKPGLITSLALKKPLIKPSAPKAAPGATGVVSSAASAATTSGTAGAASAELRQIALFIQRWKLPATQTKLLLARVSPVRRKWVMANYKGSGPLEQYIQQCERTNAWAAVGNGTAASATAAKPAAAKPAAAKPAAVGIKRPLGMLTPSAGSAIDAAKRARLTYGTGAGSSSAQVAKAGPKQPSSAPPMGSLLRGTAAARLGSTPGAKPGSLASSASAGAGPSWAAKPGSYGASSLSKPAAKLGAAAKPGSWGSGGIAAAKPAGAIGLIKPGAKPALTKPVGVKPFAAAKPAAAKPGIGLMRPAAKPSAKAAGGAGKPGSLIRSLLKSA